MARSIALFVVVSLYCFGFSYAVDWNKLTNETITQVPPQEFRTLNSQLLRTIPSKAFSGLLPAQMQEIPPSAMAGLSSAQMSHIKGVTCAVLSTDQSANLNPSACYGFEPDCIRSLSSQAISAFTPKCVADFPAHMITMLTPSQFTAIRPTSLRGLDCDHVYDIPPLLVQVITPDMLSNMSRACCFVNEERVKSLRDETLRAMTSSCIEEASDSIFQSIGVRRFVLIPKQAYSGIRYDQAMKMDRRIVDSFTLQDLLETLSGSGMMGLLSEPTYVKDLAARHGMNLVLNLTVAHIYPESYMELTAMKYSVESANLDPTKFIVHWNDIKDRLLTTNWLEIFLLDPQTNVAEVFTDEKVKQMMESNFFGLKLDMFKQVPPHMFKYATREDVSVWTYEFRGALTKEMFSQLSPEAFVQLYMDFWAISIDWIDAIPTSVIPLIDIDDLYCGQFELFTAAQKAVMSAKQLQSLEFHIKQCSIPYFPPTEQPYSETPVHNGAPTAHVPVTAPVDNGPVANPGITVGGVFAIIFAIAVVIQSSVIGYHIYNKRRRSAGAGQYDQL